MWTPATRGRMAKIEKKTKRYPSDLTDEEWARIEPFLPRASTAGRPIEVDLREVSNAIRYMARSGGGWRMLPMISRLGRRSIGGFADLSVGSCFRRSTTSR